MFFSSIVKQETATRNIKPYSSTYLYLNALIKRSVHESVERQEKGANGVQEGIPILTVPVESENQGQTLQEVLL